MKKKVFVGMSGGVDSSVAAALLKQAGYEVTGVFIKAWDAAEAEGKECGWRAERRDARRVAAQLDIPLLTLDLTAEYKREVVDYLLREYAAGRTPNPDVMCNRAIKFGAFYDWAIAHGADFVATGHYAQVFCEPTGKLQSEKITRQNSASLAPGHNGKVADETEFWLARSVDRVKDQTYFLWTLKAEQLPYILFPIGHLLKSEVRALAEKFNLPTATKPDSQGVCFVGEWNLKDFLKVEIGTKPGLVQTLDGQTIGEHDGALFYTIGERHGFKIKQNSPTQKPYYVVRRDLEKNILIVSDEPATTWAEQKQVELSDVNWISSTLPTPNPKLFARIRHRGELLPCQLTDETVTFDQAPTALALGQSLVLYDGEVCLGGGVIADF